MVRINKKKYAANKFELSHIDFSIFIMIYSFMILGIWLFEQN